MSKYKLIVILVASVHTVLAVSLVISVFVVPFLVPYFVALPIEVGIIRILTSRDRCILTDIEIHYRKKAGMYVISGFVGHYALSLPKQFVRYLRRK